MVNPQATGQNEYGDDLFQTPNGVKTGTQIMQELAAAQWDGVGNPVEVYNRTAAGGQAAASTGTSPGAGTRTTTTTQQQTGLNQLSSGIDAMLAAIAQGNQAALKEAIRQFDLSFGLDKDKFTEAVRQFNEGLGITQAGLTGQYQGQQTQQAQQQAYQQQLGLITTAAGLQANPFRQQAAMGQMNRLLGGQGVSGFGQLGTVPGAGSGGMGYLQQMIDDIRQPGTNQAGVDQVLSAIPTPNKLNSVEFFKSPVSTQSMVLQGMQEKFGITPEDALQQIRNTMPGFQAPSTYGTVKRSGGL